MEGTAQVYYGTAMKSEVPNVNQIHEGIESKGLTKPPTHTKSAKVKFSAPEWFIHNPQNYKHSSPSIDTTSHNEG
jgi:hypothetical protein